MNEIKKLPHSFYIDLIKNDIKFSFARFGDAEVLCMFNNKEISQNADGCHFSDDLTEPMKQIFRNNYNYYHASLDCTFWNHGPHRGEEFKKFIEETCPDITFFYGELWYETENIVELIQAISPHNPCFIGGKHIENMKYMKGMGEIEFIETPTIDAYNRFDKIYTAILEKYINGSRMFCFSAGYVSKLLIDKLFPIIGKEAFLLDFGSCFDPYCGVLSRAGQKLHGFEKYQPFTNKKLL